MKVLIKLMNIYLLIDCLELGSNWVDREVVIVGHNEITDLRMAMRG